jgi:hypothetical protein
LGDGGTFSKAYHVPPANACRTGLGFGDPSSAFAAFFSTPGLLAAFNIGGSLSAKDTDGGRGARFVGGIRGVLSDAPRIQPLVGKFNRAAAGQRWRTRPGFAVPLAVMTGTELQRDQRGMHHD